ncbi:MAG TPA: VOC family protein [Polyangiaceae bacterium]|nr:VOC family protein [Polyangiaceae bacterium]
MAEMTKYRPGTFCWTELATRKAGNAKKFYAELFDWAFNDNEIPGGGAYTMCRKGSRDVAALYEQGKEEIDRGVPPHWTVYIAVANVDATTERVTGLGGKVHAPPFDVMDAGRMSVVEDPTGAIFALWQAGKHPGAGLVREVNAVEWNELSSTNPAAVKPFYTGLFGWTARTSSDLGMEYTEFQLGSESVCGMMKQQQPGAPSAWLAYFSVADCDAITKKATAAGGKALAGPLDIPTVGRFSVIQDPQGAVFGILRMEEKHGK